MTRTEIQRRYRDSHPEYVQREREWSKARMARYRTTAKGMLSKMRSDRRRQCAAKG